MPWGGDCANLRWLHASCRSSDSDNTWVVLAAASVMMRHADAVGLGSIPVTSHRPSPALTGGAFCDALAGWALGSGTPVTGVLSG